MTFANENRIKGSSRIELVKAKGELVQSDNFGVRILKKEGEDQPRFAIIISKKISKLAVHRNRINRAFSEVLRRNVKYFPGSFDYVFLVKKGLAVKTTDEIVSEVIKFIRGLKNLK